MADSQQVEREAMEYDVVVVGGGPAGLAAAIRVKQRAAGAGREVSVCVLEKGSEIGAHILSGAVMDPRALNELLPDWKARGAPLATPVTEDRFYLLTKSKAIYNPHWLLPDCFINDGCYVVSLANVVRWLGREAEALGIEVFAGFAAAEVLYDEAGAVRGVATGDMGVGRNGEPTALFQPGVELVGKYTLFAEGAPSLIECESLKVVGKVKFEARVVCAGKVEFVNQSEELKSVTTGRYAEVTKLLL